ncbi:MAG: carbohydrate kinase family protein [Christensenella sp.]
MKKGICVAGNAIIDVLYPIERYPAKSELTTITGGAMQATGGCMCNVVMDLAQLDPALPLTAIGRIGNDPEGDFVEAELARFPNISTSGVLREGKTSFTAVMCENDTKLRTFFQYRGANAQLCEADFDWQNINAAILHIGYILLLDTLDEEDGEYGTRMARLLCEAKKRGIKTSVDVVSEAGERFCRLVPPALKYTDYCVINEIEAQHATGIPLRDTEDSLLTENIPKALQRLFDMGVSTWAVIHCPEGGYGMDASGAYTQKPSLHLPKGYIKGTVGAGDAFCSGVLYAAYCGQTIADAITLGTASAACSLSKEGSTEGMRTAKEAFKLYDELK